MSNDPVLRVERVGARGDGIATWQGKPVYLPLTAPGDSARVRLGPRRDVGRSGTVIELLEAGERQPPPCPHFGNCGGCALQHLSDAAYAQTKGRLVKEALAHRALDADIVEPLRFLPAAVRRRARVALRCSRSGLAQVGFHGRGTHDVVDLKACAVLHPILERLIPQLRRVAQDLLQPRESGAATMALSDRGVDLVLDLSHQPDYSTLEYLAKFAEAADLARLSWRLGEQAGPALVAQRRVPAVVFSGVAVELPPECFLQASAEADRLLAELVLGGIGDAERVADLFAGLGTLTFAIATRASRVHAIDAARSSIAALKAAAVRAALDGKVSSEMRDLEHNPLNPAELRPYDVVVFDPPRAGAYAQAQALAQSTVRAIVAVSCNPATFARDARVLVDGGYRLVRAVPIDQFLWSPHVELVAYFDRAQRPKIAGQSRLTLQHSFR